MSNSKSVIKSKRNENDESQREGEERELVDTRRYFQESKEKGKKQLNEKNEDEQENENNDSNEE